MKTAAASNQVQLSKWENSATGFVAGLLPAAGILMDHCRCCPVRCVFRRLLHMQAPPKYRQMLAGSAAALVLLGSSVSAPAAGAYEDGQGSAAAQFPGGCTAGYVWGFGSPALLGCVVLCNHETFLWCWEGFVLTLSRPSTLDAATTLLHTTFRTAHSGRPWSWWGHCVNAD